MSTQETKVTTKADKNVSTVEIVDNNRTAQQQPQQHKRLEQQPQQHKRLEQQPQQHKRPQQQQLEQHSEQGQHQQPERQREDENARKEAVALRQGLVEILQSVRQHDGRFVVFIIHEYQTKSIPLNSIN